MKNKRKLNDIFAYLQGYWRYNLYFSSFFTFLLRTHIQEQIQWRISVMDKACYEGGSCLICGCDTPALQMADKQCGKPCYPKMMNKLKWELYKINNEIKL